MAVNPKNGSAAVAALDGAVEVVPVIQPPDGSVRRIVFVKVCDGPAESDFTEKSEDAIEDPARGSGDEDAMGVADDCASQRIAVGGVSVVRAKHNRIPEGLTRFNAQSPAEHSADAADEFVAGAT